MINEKEISASSNCAAYEKTIQTNGLAMAYVPFQKYCSIYDGQKGLIAGTIFPELNQPYRKCYYAE